MAGYAPKLGADAGIRGARFSRPGLGASLAREDVPRALARVKELGWYVKIQPKAAGIASGVEPFEKLVKALERPYEEQPAFAYLSEPPRPEERVQATFCGT